MEHPLQAHFDRATALLQPLRPILQGETEGGNSLLVFDECLAENELELALHVACDFFLRDETRLVNLDTLAVIEAAHAAMSIEDDCLYRLRLKCRQQPEAFLSQITEYAATRNPMGYTEEDVPRLIKEWRAEADAQADLPTSNPSKTG
jgi:hypothetical protein